MRLRRRKQRSKENLVRSEQAMLDAEDNLRNVRSREDEVRKISGALRELRKRNHFGEQLQMIIERG